MEKVKDFIWKKGMNTKDFVDELGQVGFQSIELKKASSVFVNLNLFRPPLLSNG